MEASATDDHTGISEEKIFVTVRVRPLNGRELTLKDESVWDVADEGTLVFTESERSPHPHKYNYDRVFGPSSTSEEVYEEGAKKVVLSTLTGLNASVFAYGMTSSGKTYTMKSIMKQALVDIFVNIQRNPEREYMIRVSALEIYNEIVRDLLVVDSGALRLLDDPDRGTVVEKLTEEVVCSSSHLESILADCETRRQVAETQLNEESSRSHQIVRLIVESCPRPQGGLKSSLEGAKGEVLTASLNFVDLAGSERAGLTHAENTRFKEGGHINRSLLTLGTVIRKLSGGNKARSGHIPYRDSKLTRILQHSLGGNSRTAIVCTMSPARATLDQTRNTLSFASRAKEVTNAARVNLVVSDKLRVKQLVREVARLEEVLRSAPSPLEVQELMAQLRQLRKENAELRQERDSAVSELEGVRRGRGGAQGQPLPAGRPGVGASVDGSRAGARGDSSQASTAKGPGSEAGERGRERRRHKRAVNRSSIALVNELRKLDVLQEQLGEDASRAMEALTKEIEALKLAQAGMNQEASVTIEKLQAEVRSIQEVKYSREAGMAAPAPKDAEEDPGNSAELMDTLMLEVSRLTMKEDGRTENAIEQLEEKLDTMQASLDRYWTSTAPGADKGKAGAAGLQEPAMQRRDSITDMRRMQSLFKTAAEDNILSIRNYVAELKERVAKLHYQKDLLMDQVLELEEIKRTPSEEEDEAGQDPCPLPLPMPAPGPAPEALLPAVTAWPVQFEQKMMSIFELWERCHIPVLHRTRFYLLMTGDPTDSNYLEVECRRLAWLWEQSQEVGGREQAASLNRMKVIRKERELLARRMKTRISAADRELLFRHWGVRRRAKKRKMQVALKLWADPTDVAHVDASARLVAHLMNIRVATKELFALQFAPPTAHNY